MKIYGVAVLALAMGTLCWAQSAEKAGEELVGYHGLFDADHIPGL